MPHDPNCPAASAEDMHPCECGHDGHCIVPPKFLATVVAHRCNDMFAATTELTEPNAKEISRLRKVEEVAKAFLSEWDNPTPDYALRVNLKQRLRALVQ